MSPSIEVVVKQVEPVTVAFHGVTGHPSQIPAALGKLYDWIGGKGYKPRGPAIAVYHDIPGEVPESQLRWEVRSALSGSVAESAPDRDGLGVKRLSAAQVAAAMHKGPYKQAGETYEALLGWVAENGYEIIGPAEELYFNDPSKTPPTEPLTEIRLPVRKK